MDSRPPDRANDGLGRRSRNLRSQFDAQPTSVAELRAAWPGAWRGGALLIYSINPSALVCGSVLAMWRALEVQAIDKAKWRRRPNHQTSSSDRKQVFYFVNRTLSPSLSPSRPFYYKCCPPAPFRHMHMKAKLRPPERAKSLYVDRAPRLRAHCRWSATAATARRPAAPQRH